jgi:glycosyltransferase involved in cell wall biosynthesis
VRFLRKGEEIAALRMPADLTIMTNDGTQGDRAIRRLRGTMPSSLRFWRNGLDVDMWHPAAVDERKSARSLLGIHEDQIAVLAVSRLARWKRVDRVIRAVAAARQRLPNLLLLIVGDGEEQTALQHLTCELNLQDAVRFEGALPQHSLPRYYHAADIFVSTNELSNVGNPLLEAMACGKAIITLNNGSTSELVKSGVTGILLDEGLPPDAIGCELARLAGDVGGRQELETGASRFAADHFWSWEARMAAELRGVEALAGSRR